MATKGILLAISSLPGKYGIGDFSSETKRFIKIIKKYNFGIWQILPLNPIGFGHSPYQPYSSFVFDEIYISIDDLKKRGLYCKQNKVINRNKTNYEIARKIKEKAIYQAFKIFKKTQENMGKLTKFIEENEYVKEFAEFISLKELNNGQQWSKWTIKKEDKSDDFSYLFLKHCFAQMILFEQWNEIRKYANDNGIQIVGDVPFYVGYDSSDVYFHKESFMLDENFEPTCVAGVPPDYFSKDGQRWGNPIWNWDYLYKNEFKAMMDRIYFASKFYDIVRLDHFRAFDSYWAINPACLTAVDGEWKFPNGHLFFDTLYKKYPDINIIVEDLGELRPEVLQLRDDFNLPGMRELEFTIFDDEVYNKHFEIENMIYYTTTHDNETIVEWVNNLSENDKNILLNKINALNIKGKTLPEKLIRYALQRKEKSIIISASDFMLLDKNSRMNEPGKVNDFNWTFKLANFVKLRFSLRKFF